MDTSTSPRKTRSRSRFVSASYDPGSSPKTASPAASPFHPNTAITSVPVMKASSMEPVRSHYVQVGSAKRARHKMTDLQLERLEELYRANTHPNREAKEDLARETGMPLKTVLIWFQNRRQDRRRGKAAAAAKAAGARAERAQALKARKLSGGKLKANPQRKKSTPTAAVRPLEVASPVLPDTQAQNGGGDASLPPTAPVTVSSRADDSMDVDSSSPSTAPTSVHTMHRGTRLLPRVARSPSSSLDSSSSIDAPNALWRLVRASPPAPPPLPVATRQPFGNLQAQQVATRKPDLEWACANSASRRKHGRYVYRDEDDSEGEHSEHDGLDGQENPARPHRNATNPPVRKRWQQREAAAGHRSLTDSKVEIPREYDLLFPPDMVLGASLLLTFKNSAGSPRL